jgi:hypothetical protein
MRIKISMLLASITLLSACSDLNQAKLDYDYGSECMGSYTVHCTDVKLQLMILQAQAQQQQLIDHKTEAVQEIGEAHYDQMLALYDEKIAHLEDQRPNSLLRWFKGDEEYPVEIDQGWGINAKISALAERATAQTTPLTQSTQTPEINDSTSSDDGQAQPLSDQDQLKATLIEPVQTADQANAETTPQEE